MSYTFSGRLLLLLGAYLDYHRCVVSVPRTLAAMAGDPKFYHHRRLIEEHLRHRERLRRASFELRRRGYLQEKLFGHASGFVITTKGERRLLQLNASDHRQRSKRKKGEWLMVFFDIPESRKRQRDGLRNTLKALGFHQVQKSVWATPYNVLPQLEEMLKLLGLREYVKPLLVRELPA